MPNQFIPIVVDILTEINLVMQRKCLGRGELVDHLRERLGYPISPHTVEGWFKRSRPDLLPGIGALLSICEYVGSYEPLAPLFAPFGMCLVDEREERTIEAIRKLNELRMLLEQGEEAHAPREECSVP